MPPKPNLDLIRAVAVLAVVLDHTLLALHQPGPAGWDLTSAGIIGVYIFFVHTSLVLMWSLERSPHTLDFYVRRIFRIYPLAIVGISVALLCRAPLSGTVQNLFQRPNFTHLDILANFLLATNLKAGCPVIVYVMWTLPLEVQMYIALPILFAFVRGVRRLWPLLLLWCLVVRFCTVTFPDKNLVCLATVVPMFLPGVMAYVGFSRWRPRLPAGLLPAYLVLLFFLGTRHLTNRNGWYVALALGLALPLFRQARAPWVVRSSHEIAKYSYGIYLVHPFALVVGMYLLAGRSIAVQLPIALAIIVLGAVAAYHLIELPCIRLGKHIANRIDAGMQRVSPRLEAPYTS